METNAETEIKIIIYTENFQSSRMHSLEEFQASYTFYRTLFSLTLSIQLLTLEGREGI
jgi:hypothetical protein